MDVSDRIAVIYNGEIAGIVDASATNENELGLMMSGALRKSSAKTKIAREPARA